MDRKKSETNMLKMELPTDTPIEFELGDTAADRHPEEEGG